MELKHTVEDIMELNKDFPFEKVENYLKGLGLLKFEIDLPVDENLIHSVLQKQQLYKTLFENDGEEYCKAGYGYRSIKDIFRIAVHYNPNLTLKEVYYYLYSNILKNNYYCWICETLRKVVYRWCRYSDEVSPCFINVPTGCDEFGFIIPKDYMIGGRHGYAATLNTEEIEN